MKSCDMIGIEYKQPSVAVEEIEVYIDKMHTLEGKSLKELKAYYIGAQQGAKIAILAMRTVNPIDFSQLTV